MRTTVNPLYKRKLSIILIASARVSVFIYIKFILDAQVLFSGLSVNVGCTPDQLVFSVIFNAVVVVDFSCFQLLIVAHTDPCQNIISDQRCTSWKFYCKINSYVQQKCAETCGKCPGLLSTLIHDLTIHLFRSYISLHYISLSSNRTFLSNGRKCPNKRYQEIIEV